MGCGSSTTGPTPESSHQNVKQRDEPQTSSGNEKPGEPGMAPESPKSAESPPAPQEPPPPVIAEPVAEPEAHAAPPPNAGESPKAAAEPQPEQPPPQQDEGVVVLKEYVPPGAQAKSEPAAESPRTAPAVASPRAAVASPRASVASPRAAVASPRAAVASPRAAVASPRAAPAAAEPAAPPAEPAPAPKPSALDAMLHEEKDNEPEVELELHQPNNARPVEPPRALSPRDAAPPAAEPSPAPAPQRQPSVKKDMYGRPIKDEPLLEPIRSNSGKKQKEPEKEPEKDTSMFPTIAPRFQGSRQTSDDAYGFGAPDQKKGLPSIFGGAGKPEPVQLAILALEQKKMREEHEKNMGSLALIEKMRGQQS